MGRLGYSAVGVAERDLVLGYDELEKKTAGAPFPLVSTNFVRRGTSEPVFKPYVIVEAKRGQGKPPLRIGVLSVVRFNPMFLKTGPSASNVSIAEPADMVRKYLDEVRKQADVVVLLAELAVYDAHQIAKAFPGIDYVFGAYGGTYSSQEESEGNTRIVFTGNQGKRVGETRVFLGDRNRILTQESYLYFLTGRYPDDPETRGWTEMTLARIKPAAGTPAAPGPAPAARGGTSP